MLSSRRKILFPWDLYGRPPGQVGPSFGKRELEYKCTYSMKSRVMRIRVRFQDRQGHGLGVLASERPMQGKPSIKTLLTRSIWVRLQDRQDHGLGLLTS